MSISYSESTQYLLQQAEHIVLSFIKPHAANCFEIIEKVIPSFIDHYGIEVLYQKSSKASPELIWRNYSPESWFADYSFNETRNFLNSADRITLNEKLKYWHNPYENRIGIVSASTALEKYSLTVDMLNKAWEQSDDGITVTYGCHLKKVYISGKDPFVVVNGYMPYRLREFFSYGKDVHIYLLRLPPDINIAAARRDFIGNIDGNTSSIRGYFGSKRDQYGIHIDKFNNVIHCSSSVGASLLETSVWLPDLIGLHPLAKATKQSTGLGDSYINNALAAPECGFNFSQSSSVRILQHLTDTIYKAT